MEGRKITQITDTFTYWLGRRGFCLNNEYQIDLIWIDKINNSVKIQITNLKNKQTSSFDVPTSDEGGNYGL
jgi:hypothetical protein